MKDESDEMRKSPAKWRIYRKTFLTLLQAVEATFRLQCEKKNVSVPLSTSVYFGFDPTVANDPTQPSIYNFVEADRKPSQRVGKIGLALTENKDQSTINYSEKEAEIKLSPKFLYDRKLEANKLVEFETLDIKPELLNIFLKYVGFHSLEEFLNQYPDLKRERPFQLEILKAPKKRLSPYAINFHGYYYSRDSLSHCESFLIRKDRKNMADGQFPVAIEGLHKTAEEPNDESYYEGMATETVSCIHMSLKDKINNRPLNLIWYKSVLHTHNLKYGSALLMGISKEGMPISFEVLCKREKESNLTFDLPHIKTFLQMRRNHIRLPKEILSDPTMLRPHQNETVGDLLHLRGTYRIWNFRWSDSAIVQSKFTIDDDFKASLATILWEKEPESKQACVMSISHIEETEPKLCVASHTPMDEGNEVVNFAIFSLKGMNSIKASKGVFCGQAKKPNPDSFSESLVILKEDANTKLEPRIFTPQELIDLCNGQTRGKLYKQMLEELFRAHGVTHSLGKKSSRSKRTEARLSASDNKLSIERVRFVDFSKLPNPDMPPITFSKRREFQRLRENKSLQHQRLIDFYHELSPSIFTNNSSAEH